MKNLITTPTNGVFTQIPTHKKPHIEEVASLVLLEDYGENVFPGIKNAKVVFWDAGWQTPKNQTWEQLNRQGVFPAIGCGGSIFDEHDTPTRPRIEGECSLTLIIKALGLDQEMWLEKVTKYCLVTDLKGGSHPYDPASIIKLINDEWFDRDPQYALQLAKQIVKVMFNDQIRFFNEAGSAYRGCSEVHEGFHNRKKIKVISLVTDDSNMAKYARSKFGDEADVVIKKDSLGHVYISTAKKSNINLDDVIALLRLEEMRIKTNGKPVNTKLGDLQVAGTMVGVEEWHYEPTHPAIFNGSKTATEKPATKIPFERIIYIVLFGLNEKTFPNQHYKLCLTGKCAGKVCPLYEANLRRCYA